MADANVESTLLFILAPANGNYPTNGCVGCTKGNYSTPMVIRNYHTYIVALNFIYHYTVKMKRKK